MKLYNTLSRTKEDFVPIKEGEVGIYNCGPTVYNFIHVGNARPLVVFDTLRRYFTYKGMKVKFVVNFMMKAYRYLILPKDTSRSLNKMLMVFTFTIMKP